MEWPKGRQLAAHDKHAQQAFELALQYMVDNRDKIIKESKQRLGGQGFDQYLDQSFKLTLPQLKKGAREELDDAVNYFVIALAKGAL